MSGSSSKRGQSCDDDAGSGSSESKQPQLILASPGKKPKLEGSAASESPGTSSATGGAAQKHVYNWAKRELEDLRIMARNRLPAARLEGVNTREAYIEMLTLWDQEHGNPEGELCLEPEIILVDTAKSEDATLNPVRYYRQGALHFVSRSIKLKDKKEFEARIQRIAVHLSWAENKLAKALLLKLATMSSPWLEAYSQVVAGGVLVQGNQFKDVEGPNCEFKDSVQDGGTTTDSDKAAGKQSKGMKKAKALIADFVGPYSCAVLNAAEPTTSHLLLGVADDRTINGLSLLPKDDLPEEVVQRYDSEVKRGNTLQAENQTLKERLAKLEAPAVIESLYVIHLVIVRNKNSLFSHHDLFYVRSESSTIRMKREEVLSNAALYHPRPPVPTGM
ncbi:hypothetical protein HDU87_008748 [Geranomyces variabilis]|uniref:Uncharacterized protein n=1 Tax=Geranomyces variabilis TaxID=109894 RepID=A0AAD5XP32_9FUNG|nr:hypothetical protein HDU87_008748 [Geranomyces variabilis]